MNNKLTCEYAKAHPELTFLYGGCAYTREGLEVEEANYLPNCYKIPVRKKQCPGSDNYWYDYEIDLFKVAVEVALKIVPRNKPIVYDPRIGLSKGQLKRRAPECYKWLIETLKAL